MIGSLTGKLTRLEPPECVVDVNGVGYELKIPLTGSLLQLVVGQTVQFITHLSIREDEHTLYGFASLSERHLFRQLLKVSGIGPKAALGILSGLPGKTLVEAIQQKDIAMLTRLPGVGKKTAERMVVELGNMKGFLPDTLSDEMPMSLASTTQHEAMSALEALGYSAKEAQKALKRVANAETHSVESLIKQALQGLVGA